MINLQLFRYRLVGRKDMKKALSMGGRWVCCYIDVIRYLSHLFYRRISKRAVVLILLSPKHEFMCDILIMQRFYEIFVWRCLMKLR